MMCYGSGLGRHANSHSTIQGTLMVGLQAETVRRFNAVCIASLIYNEECFTDFLCQQVSVLSNKPAFEKRIDGL